MMRSGLMELDTRFMRCPMCDSLAGYRKDRQGDYRAECCNTSCAVATPYHYKTPEQAMEAWNRRPSPAAEPKG